MSLVSGNFDFQPLAIFFVYCVLYAKLLEENLFPVWCVRVFVASCLWSTWETEFTLANFCSKTSKPESRILWKCRLFLVRIWTFCFCPWTYSWSPSMIFNVYLFIFSKLISRSTVSYLGSHLVLFTSFTLDSLHI